MRSRTRSNTRSAPAASTRPGFPPTSSDLIENKQDWEGGVGVALGGLKHALKFCVLGVNVLTPKQMFGTLGSWRGKGAHPSRNCWRRSTSFKLGMSAG